MRGMAEAGRTADNRQLSGSEQHKKLAVATRRESATGAMRGDCSCPTFYCSSTRHGRDGGRMVESCIIRLLDRDS